VKLVITVVLPDGSEVTAGEIESIGSPGRETVEFRYTDSFLRNPLAYDLSPELRLGLGRFTASGTRTMLGGISDAQPDAWGRRLIEFQRKRTARLSGTRYTRATEMDVLAAVPDRTRQGALRVLADGMYVSQVSTAPLLPQLPDLVEAARAFEADEEVDGRFLALLDAGSPMGGARPKATVQMDDGTLAIAKLPSDDDFGDAMAWEATALELARLSGVTVPRFELHRLGARSVLVIERFDRADGQRIGYLSADSLLVKQQGEITSYTQLAHAMALVSSNPKRDGRELLRRVAVTLLVNNFDDHMRNHGLLRERNGWRLSPAFDINPFYRHGTAPSTPISDADDPSDRDIRNLLSSSDAFSVSESETLQIIREVEKVTGTWRSVAARFGITPEGANAMQSAFDSPNREEVERMAPQKRRSPAVSSAGQLREIDGRFGERTQSVPEVGLEPD
jgi:serine/threonine-protein kinase HipA